MHTARGNVLKMVVHRVRLHSINPILRILANAEGVTNIEDLRKRTTMYFGGVMDQAAATFKSNARSFVIMLSIFLTLLLGTDSIQLAQTLWANAGLRALAVAKAEVPGSAEPQFRFGSSLFSVE